MSNNNPHRIKIIRNSKSEETEFLSPNNVRLFIDDKEIIGATEIEFHFDTGSMPSFSFNMYCAEIDIQGIHPMDIKEEKKDD